MKSYKKSIKSCYITFELYIELNLMIWLQYRMRYHRTLLCFQGRELGTQTRLLSLSLSVCVCSLSAVLLSFPFYHDFHTMPRSSFNEHNTIIWNDEKLTLIWHAPLHFNTTIITSNSPILVSIPLSLLQNSFKSFFKYTYSYFTNHQSTRTRSGWHLTST